MHRLGLPVGEIAGSEPPSATVTCLTSPLGMEFALIDAGPQAISGRRTDQPASVWLAVLLEGSATLESEGVEQSLAVGDIAYGPTGRTASPGPRNPLPPDVRSRRRAWRSTTAWSRSGA